MPQSSYIGHVGQTQTGIIQCIYTIGERPTVRKFVQYLDSGGKRVTPAA